MPERTDISKILILVGIALFVPSAARANSCGPPKRISVPRACGKVLDSAGNPIANLEVGLVSTTGQSMANTSTDGSGDFSFLQVKPGSYNLYSKSEPWDDIRWPVKFSKGKGNKCDHPLYVVLSPKSGWACTSWVVKKKPDLKPTTDH